MNQYIHYGECVRFQYFGKYIEDPVSDPKIPENFNLNNIRAKITLHYGAADPLANPANVIALQSKIPNVCFSKLVDSPTFDHADFAIAIHANSLVYVDIVNAWNTNCSMN